MALPTYVASGTASSGATSPRTPAYPAGLAANDRLILQVFVRATDATCPTPSGWTYEYEDPITGYGVHFIFSKLATGSETGTVSVTWTGSTTPAIARIYAFRGVTPAARWYEPQGNTHTIGGLVVNMPTVTTTGNDRLAIALTAYAAGNRTVASSTGEAGGDWIEPVTEATSGSAVGGGLQLQTAGLTTAGILSGGTASLSGTVNGNSARGMALIATGGTLAVGAPIFETRGEAVANNTVTTGGLMAPVNGIVVAHVVAKHASAAVATFINHPTDDTGGFWELLHQNVQGTGPALRAAVFYRLVATTAKKIDSIAFIANSTPESLSITVYTVAAGDGDNLVNFKSALSTTGDPSVTLDTAPAATSAVMCFYGGNGTGSPGTTPTGFTQLTTDTIATHQRQAVYYDALSPVQSAAFSTTNTQSVAILAEIPLISSVTAVTGTAARTLSPLTGLATGVRGVVATAATGTIAPLTGVATGARGVSGTATRTLAALTGVASGQFVPFYGTAARTLAGLTATASGTHIPYAGIGVGIVQLAGPGGVGGPWSDGTLWSDGTGWAAAGGTVAFGVHGVVVTTAAGLVNPLNGLAVGVRGVVATAARTLAPLAGAAAGVHAIGGTAARTLAPLAGLADGTVSAPIDPHTGTGARTLAVLAGAAAAVHSVAGTATGVAQATGSAAATFVMATGTAARTLAPLVGVATGAQAVSGTATRTLGVLTGDASGIHGQPITGTAARTLTSLDGFALASHAVTGTGARTLALTGVAVAGHGVASVAQKNLAPLAGAATGAHAVGGQAARTLAPLVGTAVAVHGLVVGTAAVTVTPATGVSFGAHGVAAVFGVSVALVVPVGAAAGIHAIGGAGARTVAPLAGVATGVHGVAGTAARTLTALAGVATAVHGSITATAARTLAPLVGISSGVHGVAGTAASTLAPLTGAAIAFHGQPHTGTATRTLLPLSGSAIADHGVAGTAARTLAATGAATAGHGVSGTAARTLVAPTSTATGLHILTFVGVGTGLVAPIHGAALGVRGVVSTAAGTVLPLDGDAVGQVGVSIFGTAAGELRPVSIAIGHFETPISYIHDFICPITGFKLSKDNAEYDPVRRAYVHRDNADDPEPRPRRPFERPPSAHLR